MKKILFILSFFAFNMIEAQIIINEVLLPTNELELKNIGSNTINLQSTLIQSDGGSIFISDATNFICGGLNVPPGGIVVVPIPYPTISAGGSFFVYQNGQIPTSYIQWGGVQGYATLAFSEGLWDNPMAFVPAPISGESIELVVESQRRNPFGWLSQDDPTPCNENTQCRIQDVKISNLSCNDNGTSNDPTDDYFTFSLKFEGINLPSSVNLSIPNGSLSPSTIDPNCSSCVITAPPGSANGDEILLDAVSGNNECSFLKIFIAPESCSEECSMESSQLIVLECIDNNTPADPSDDYIHFVVKPFGFNLDEEYFVEFSFGNVVGPLQNMTPFTVLSSEGFYVPGDGDFSVTIIDGGDSNCTQTLNVVNQDNCSPNCVIDIDSLGVYCENSGTPFDESDDFYTVDIQMSSTASASTDFQLSLDPFLASPQFFEYGILHSISSASGSTNVINNYALTVIDPDYPTCIGITLNGMLNEGCLEPCEVFSPDIALDGGPLICLEPGDQSIFTFEVNNGIILDSFILLALDVNDDIVFFTNKLSFDAREFEMGTYRFVLVNYLALTGVQVGADIGRLEGCFALSPFVEIEITFQEKCSTSTKDINDQTLTVYPNPVTQLLCIETNFIEPFITIFDIHGQLIRETSKSKCLSMANLENGTYFLSVQKSTKEARTWKRFVKI